jgi:hypothetical protein
MCGAVGLSPATHPFDFIVFADGKEHLYARRGATDQLAKIHKINREIIDGPKLVTVGGQEMMVATCRATHPDGRVDTATGAYLVANDPALAYMTSETKAKRRAVLSILGLGMLDECEVVPGSTVSGHNETGASAVQSEASEAKYTGPASSPELELFQADILAIEQPEDAAALWLKAKRGAYWKPEDKRAEMVAWQGLCQHLVTRFRTRNVDVWIRAMVSKLEGGIGRAAKGS